MVFVDESTELRRHPIIPNRVYYFPDSCCCQVYEKQLEKMEFNFGWSDFFPSLKTLMVSLLQGNPNSDATYVVIIHLENALRLALSIIK